MISEYAKFTTGPITFEVNWEEDVVPCKLIRVTSGENVDFIERNDLYGMLMLFGNDEQQEQLIPVTKTEMVLIERLLHIKMQRPLEKGEIVTVPYRYSVTRDAYEKLVAENPRQYRIVEELSTGEKPEAS
jgi:hypothetical protein